MANPNPSVFHTGYLGTAVINGIEFGMLAAELPFTADLIPFENSLTGPIPAYEGTFQHAGVSITADYDFANAPFLQGLKPSNSVDCKIYLHQTTKSGLQGPFFDIPNFVISAMPVTVPIKGKVGIRITGVASLVFTVPTT